MARRNWAEIGRAIFDETKDLPKQQRVSLRKQKAIELGIAPHTLGRYMVLSQFLIRVGVSNADSDKFSTALMEIISRAYDFDAKYALNILEKARKGIITDREAREDLRRIQPKNESKPIIKIDKDYLMDRVADLLKQDIESIVIQASNRSSSLTFEDAIMKCELGEIAFLDEDLLATNFKRGSLHFARSVIVAAAVFDVVVAHFSTDKSKGSFIDYLSTVHEDVGKRIKIMNGTYIPSS